LFCFFCLPSRLSPTIRESKSRSSHKSALREEKRKLFEKAQNDEPALTCYEIEGHKPKYIEKTTKVFNRKMAVDIADCIFLTKSTETMNEKLLIGRFFCVHFIFIARKKVLKKHKTQN
jgi:hypothetical protein